MTMSPLNSKEYILTLIDNILKNIGQTEDIISTNEITTILNKVSTKLEKEKLDSILYQLQLMNIQMEDIKWLNNSYRMMHEYAIICSKTLDESFLLNKAYEMVSQVMAADAFSISLYDEEKEEIQFLIMIEDGISYPTLKINLSDNYTSNAIRTKKIIHIQKAASPDTNLPDKTFGKNDTKSCLFVPIIVDEQVRGVISVQSFTSFAYNQEHEELIQIIGTQVINSIYTARIFDISYKRARTDEMTQLKNYRAFQEDLQRITEEKSLFSLIMIDADNLKSINDRYGHDFGDQYLTHLASGLHKVRGPFIRAYRYAGDEFMLLVKTEDQSVLSQILSQLFSYYKNTPLEFEEEKIYISISTGVAYYPINGTTVESIKKSVDMALYRAKKLGKNKIVYAY